MFEIEYKGGNTVIIATKKSKLVADPRQSLLGLKDIHPKDSVEVATEERFALNDADARLHIEGPGAYEVGDFSITGVAVRRHLDAPDQELKGTAYRIEIGEVAIILLGNIAPELTEDQLEELGVADIVIIPVGGNGYTLDPTGAVSVIRAIEPKVVIPVHYADSALAYEVPQESVDVFISEMSLPVEKPGSKLKMKGASSLPATTTVMQIERS